jgi:hypothetical protein
MAEEIKPPLNAMELKVTIWFWPFKANRTQILQQCHVNKL